MGFASSLKCVALLGAVIGLHAAPALAEPTTRCESANGYAKATVLVGGVVATAAVTEVEYTSMAQAGRWHASDERDRGAILADPSSHLHAFGSYQLARVTSAVQRQQCRTAGRAAWEGAAYAMSLGVAKEISDGWFGGFSTTDLAVDALGAGYAVMQSYAPMLQHVNPTFSLSPHAIHMSARGRGLLTNYGAQTAWLSADMHDLLPQSARHLWPSPLRLSVGRRAYQNATPDQWVLGLDLNASKLPGNNAVWRQAKRVLGSYRLPGPALVFSSNGTRAFGLYW